MTFTVELEQQSDGRWIGEVPQLPGTFVYGASPQEATARAKALALRVLADRLEHGEADVGRHHLRRGVTRGLRRRPAAFSPLCCG